MNKKRIALAITIERRKERKQFCAFSAHARFHTAWVKLGSGRARTGCPFHPQEPTSSERAAMSVWCQHATYAPQQVVALLNHLIGAAEQRRRDGETERLRSFEVDYQLDFGGLLDWQVRWLLALENATRVAASQAVGVCNTASVASQPASHHELVILVDSRYRVECRQCGKFFGVAAKQWIGADHECTCA